MWEHDGMKASAAVIQHTYRNKPEVKAEMIIFCLLFGASDKDNNRPLSFALFMMN